ncbi:MAG: ATP-binding protein [Candidatus Gracilibacteria bacterium]|nr:ATP-binding protein [Candidatus Gracilibacteria bacterium]
MDLINFNKHWIKEYYYNFEKKRNYYDKMIKNIDSKYIDLIIGLRRVGKTTLMFQVINYLIKQGINRDNILYYSFDLGNEIENVINDYLRVSNKDILKDKIYVFFDEIQKVNDWQNKIKIYYDLYPNIKIFLSGSSSLFLKSSESLAGRIVITNIKTLYFEEYLEFKDLKYYLDKPRLYEKNLILEFEKYLYRQYYDIINSNLFDAKDYVFNLKNKIIKEDANDFFNVNYPELLLKLFDIVAANPGITIDYHNLGNDLNVDWRTIQTYIYYLEESFLINKVYNYSANLLSSEKKQKKAYLNCSSFFSGNGEISGELFENYIQNYFDFKYFYRHSKNEVDFVGVTQQGKIYAIEVKYRENIKKEHMKGLSYFQKKFKVDKKIIISKNVDEIFGDVIVVPFWKLESINMNN